MAKAFSGFGRGARSETAYLDGEALMASFAPMRAAPAAATAFDTVANAPAKLGFAPVEPTTTPRHDYVGVGMADAPSARTRAAPQSPSATQEVTFINGVNPDGTLSDISFWGYNDQTAYKWGDAVLGTGATITYSFSTAARFSPIEKQTFLKAFEMWESVADVTFVEVASNTGANLLLKRGNDGSAYANTPTSNGFGRVPGSVTGQAFISIDTSTPGFDLSGSFSRTNGYGLSTVIHEVGHVLGLGHGGTYNGSANARTDQFSAFDDRLFTIMSYISWTDTDAKYLSQNPIQGTNWGQGDGSLRAAPHSWMALDIVAIQQLYGVSKNSVFDGGQIYGFHSNIEGQPGDFYDFSANTSPVVTIYNQGSNNTLDLTEYFRDSYVDLRPGQFSSVGGLVNNLSIAFGTKVETAILGAGNDTVVASDTSSLLSGGGGADALYGGKGKDVLRGDGGNDWLIGNAGQDAMFGGSGADTFWFLTAKDTGKVANKADLILDFERLDGDIINLSNIDAMPGRGDNAFRFIGTAAFSRNPGELRYQFAGADALVTGDINGDGAADFAILIKDAAGVLVTDFVL